MFRGGFYNFFIMETKEIVRTVKNDGLIKGRWKLTYTLVNRLGSEGFSGKLISSYTDPFNGKARHLFDPDGAFMAGFFMGRTTMILDPERNPWHTTLVDWLLGHPEVGIDNSQAKLDSKYIERKVSNPRFKIVNLDHQDVVDLVEEDYIDKLVGRISADTGSQSIGIEKLRFVLTKLGLQYRIEKLINNPSIEKQKLRKKLKDYVRESYNNAVKVNDILDNLTEAGYLYQIAEMIRFEIITVNNGMFMCKGNSIGISKESIIKYFVNTPEFYTELKLELSEKQKQEQGK